jgi:lipopolysaccharide export system protein LptC
VLSPRFEGFDSNDRPYSLTAETARRRRENVSLIDLVSPRLEDAASTVVQAREGVWNSETEILELVGDVVMTDAGGYTFTSQRTRMYVKENRVQGQTPLNGVGPIGEVRADEYEVLDDGNRIVLTGNVWTRFQAKKKRGEVTRAGGR